MRGGRQACRRREVRGKGSEDGRRAAAGWVPASHRRWAGRQMRRGHGRAPRPALAPNGKAAICSFAHLPVCAAAPQAPRLSEPVLAPGPRPSVWPPAPGSSSSSPQGPPDARPSPSRGEISEVTLLVARRRAHATSHPRASGCDSDPVRSPVAASGWRRAGQGRPGALARAAAAGEREGWRVASGIATGRVRPSRASSLRRRRRPLVVRARDTASGAMRHRPRDAPRPPPPSVRRRSRRLRVALPAAPVPSFTTQGGAGGTRSGLGLAFGRVARPLASTGVNGDSLVITVICPVLGPETAPCGPALSISGKPCGRFRRRDGSPVSLATPYVSY